MDEVQSDWVLLFQLNLTHDLPELVAPKIETRTGVAPHYYEVVINTYLYAVYLFSHKVILEFPHD